MPAANLGGMERSEAEAIFDSGREACVEFLMGLMDRQLRSEERLRVLEQKAGASSRNSSSPPSTDAPKTPQQRRQEAREKAKELARKDAEKREAGAQHGHRGAGRGLTAEDRMDEIVEHYPEQCGGCGHELTEQEQVPRHGLALTARNQISRRDMSELLWELFGVGISVGAIDRVCQPTRGCSPARTSVCAARCWPVALSTSMRPAGA